MARTHSKQTEPAITPLLPLEYCTIDRAATLLGCEMEDILHWCATGAVNLHANFQDETTYEYSRYIFHDTQEIYAHVSIGEKHENKLITHDDMRRESYYGKHISINNVINFSGIEERWLESEAFVELYIPPLEQVFFHLPVKAEGYVKLSGFFALIIENECANSIAKRIDLKEINIMISSNNNFLGLTLNKPGDIYPLLRVTHKEMLKMQKHISSGQPFKSETHPFEQFDANITSRVTANQSKAIVDLLIALGYTLDDLQGSAEALQQKIAKNGHSSHLSGAITPKTLRAWISRGGSR